MCTNPPNSVQVSSGFPLFFSQLRVIADLDMMVNPPPFITAGLPQVTLPAWGANLRIEGGYRKVTDEILNDSRENSPTHPLY